MSDRTAKSIPRQVAGLLVAGMLALLAVPATPTQGAVPEASVPLEAAAERAAQLPRLHSLLVSHRGELILERYFNGTRPARPANIKSASKSVLSALVGIAIHEGLIDSVRDPLEKHFPALLDTQQDARKRRITIENLLTMQSGLESTSNRNYGTWVQSQNWVRHALSRPLLREPGTVMDYSTGNTHLLSAILTRATRGSTWEFAQEKLAKPLGFTLARWPQDPQGIYFGGNDMEMTPRQMLAFGELYLTQGSASGRQIIPASWVSASLTPRAQSRRDHQRFYGYGWWMRELGGHPAFYAWGYGGQFIFLIPSLELVVVTTSSIAAGDERGRHNRMVYDLVERFVIPSIASRTSQASGVR